MPSRAASTAKAFFPAQLLSLLLLVRYSFSELIRHHLTSRKEWIGELAELKKSRHLHITTEFMDRDWTMLRCFVWM